MTVHRLLYYSLPQRSSRYFSTTSSSPSMNVFDRNLKISQLNTAASSPISSEFDYVRTEIARRLVSRLNDIKEEPFSTVIDWGSGPGYIATELVNLHVSALPHSIQTIHQIDAAKDYLFRDTKEQSSQIGNLKIYRHHQDEETYISSEPVDLIVSSMALHWCNDLPGILSRIRSSLRPGGCFLGALMGGRTLQELRSSFALAEMERLGGLAPHISPMCSGADLTSLMQQAGFSVPTVDSDILIIPYPEMFTLMNHLKQGGGQHCAHARAQVVGRDVMMSAAAIYENLYGENQLIPATMEVLFVIGWNASSKDPQPLARGSATQKFGQNALAKKT